MMSMPMSPRPSGVGFNRVPWEQSANPKPRQDGGGTTKPFDNGAVSNMFAVGLGYVDPVTGEDVGGGIQEIVNPWDNSGDPPGPPQQQPPLPEHYTRPFQLADSDIMAKLIAALGR